MRVAGKTDVGCKYSRDNAKPQTQQTQITVIVRRPKKQIQSLSWENNSVSLLSFPPLPPSHVSQVSVLTNLCHLFVVLCLAFAAIYTFQEKWFIDPAKSGLATVLLRSLKPRNIRCR